MTVITKEKVKVWVYQAPFSFTEQQIKIVQEKLHGFVQEWSSHGAMLSAEAEILKNQFILFKVDESYVAASGCSIDKSVAVIRELESLLNCSLTDRAKVAFDIDGAIEVVDFKEIKQKVEAGIITPTTYMYNNTITTLKEFEETWHIQAQNSWVSRYF